MDFTQQFRNLANNYNLNYQYQEFENCYGGNWFVYTHSLYNDSGCFTILCLSQRGELSCYYAKNFSNDMDELCGKEIDIFEVEKEIWRKNERVGFLKKPFYYWNPNRIIKTLIEIITVSLERNNEFFGIKIIPPYT